MVLNFLSVFVVQLYFPMEQDMVEAPSLEEMLFSKYLCHSSLTVTPSKLIKTDQLLIKNTINDWFNNSNKVQTKEQT